MATNETDTRAPSRLWDLPVAFVLLTRLPLPPLPHSAFKQGARAVWAYPLVGLGLGLIVSGLTWLAALALPSVIVAGLVLGALVMLTGAMHEDGFADTADGLWGGNDAARRLEIMKDSRIGAYGVLALLLAMGLRWQGLVDVTWGGLITALVVSRAMMVPLMRALSHARDNGLAHSVGRPEMGDVSLALGIAAVLAVLFSGATGIIALIIAAAVTVGMGALAKTKIGGQTGDILGATQIATEIAVLLVLVAA
ncbi:MAG: adenosylcobinamide-GDP ribazoletransferase [Tateyamaria sp.]|uniref:adenosylcobinamide-GDP ribazoletransferase n=1 Tax=Tateyamaria sp. TaxID=1929288 RepID=UPI003292FD39